MKITFFCSIRCPTCTMRIRFGVIIPIRRHTAFDDSSAEQPRVSYSSCSRYLIMFCSFNLGDSSVGKTFFHYAFTHERFRGEMEYFPTCEFMDNSVDMKVNERDICLQINELPTQFDHQPLYKSFISSADSIFLFLSLSFSFHALLCL